MIRRVVGCVFFSLVGNGPLVAEEPLDLVARIVSPEFRRLDDQLSDLRHGELPPRAPLAHSTRFGYHSRTVSRPDSLRWVQVDLGEPIPLDMIVLAPAAIPPGDDRPGSSFPTEFRVEVADRDDFAEPIILADCRSETGFPPDRPILIPASGRSARFVRFTAVRLAGRGRLHFVSLGELMALSGVRNVAAGKPVLAPDSIENSPVWGRNNLVDSQSIIGPPFGPIPSSSNGYHAAVSSVADSEKWVQVDLGSPQTLDEIRLIPARPRDFADRSGFGFPLRYRVEASSDVEFAHPIVLLDETAHDTPNPGDGPVVVPANGVSARYVRMTATRLWERTGDYVFALAELQIYSGGANVARDAPVSALDSIESGLWSARYLVDGFGSQFVLLEWPDWAFLEQRRVMREYQLAEIEDRLAVSRDRVTTNLVRGIGGFTGLGTFLVIGLAWRSQVRHRRDAEQLRDRIARDLHDDVGSNLGSILLIAESASRRFGEPAQRDLTEIARIARETAESMRDLVWLLGRGSDTAEELLARMREVAAGLLIGVESEFIATSDCLPPRVPLEFRRHLFLSFKEAVHNAARHSGAKRVTVRCHRTGSRFVLEITDDGHGFDPTRTTTGTGLRSLRARAMALHGELIVESQPNRGTTVRFTLPLNRV